MAAINKFRILTNRHLLEICKCILMLSLGITLKTLYDMPSNKCDCPRCPNCRDDHELLYSELHFQLREAFIPRDAREVLLYEFFNMSYVAENSDVAPLHKIFRHQKIDIKDMVNQMMPLFNSAKGSAWRMLKLVNGFRRFDPLRGEEYVIDAVLSPDTDGSKTERYRFEMVKPFGVAHMVQNRIVDADKMIHILLSISSADSHFHRFMHNFEEICLKTEEPSYLLISLFTGEGNKRAAEYNKVKATTVALTQKYRNAHIRIIYTKKSFSDPAGLDLGSKQLPLSSLILFANVGHSFDREFLYRCRMNAVEGQQVFYPIGFAQYSPHIVTHFSGQKTKINLMGISKNTGFWSTENYEVSCMYNADYRLIHGFNRNLSNWDRDFFQRQIAAKLKVFRAMDPGLIHVYQNKTCPITGEEEEWKHCMEHALGILGSRQQLSRVLMKHFV